MEGDGWTRSRLPAWREVVRNHGCCRGWSKLRRVGTNYGHVKQASVVNHSPHLLSAGTDRSSSEKRCLVRTDAAPQARWGRGEVGWGCLTVNTAAKQRWKVAVGHHGVTARSGGGGKEQEGGKALETRPSEMVRSRARIRGGDQSQAESNFHSSPVSLLISL